jgi:hypothetical protein
MAKDPWGQKPAQWNTKAGLAFKILGAKSAQSGGLNPYDDARALNAPGQPDLWRSLVQGNNRPERDWDHNQETLEIVRSARVPYLILDKKLGREHHLEHLLVGYAVPDPDDLLTNSNGLVWADGPPGRLKDLGDFLVVDLRPADVTELRPLINAWDQDNDEDPAEPDYATGDAKHAWTFRGTEYRVEKSIRILMEATHADNSIRRRYLIVGYEGGGAW